MLIGDDEYKTEVSLPALVEVRPGAAGLRRDDHPQRPAGQEPLSRHGRGDRQERPGAGERPPPPAAEGRSGRPAGPHRRRQAAGRHPHRLPRLEPAKREGTQAARWPTGMPPGRSSTPKCSAATTRATTATGRRPRSTLAAKCGRAPDPPRRRCDVAGRQRLALQGQPAGRREPRRCSIGTIPGQEPEPVAWTNLAGPKQARVFFTSLGHMETSRTRPSASCS